MYLCTSSQDVDVMLHFTIQNEQESQRKCSLTVTVSKHNTGVLPTQLQSHSLQIAFRCCFFYQLAYLHKWAYTENTTEITLTAKSYKQLHVCKMLHAVCIKQDQRSKGVTAWSLVIRYSPSLFINLLLSPSHWKHQERGKKKNTKRNKCQPRIFI